MMSIPQSVTHFKDLCGCRGDPRSLYISNGHGEWAAIPIPTVAHLVDILIKGIEEGVSMVGKYG